MIGLRVVVAIVVGSAMLGCSDEAGPPQIVITTRDFSFESPVEAVGGLVRVTVDNEGTQPHQVELVRARDGASSSDIIAAVQRMDAAALDAMVTYHGGPNEVPPGERRTTITDLEPGRYVILCFVAAPDGQLHVHKGMVGVIDITDPEAPSDWTPPTTELEVELDDYRFAVSGDPTAGTHLVHIRNIGTEPHEFRVMGSGGSSTISPGAETWVELVVEPATYQVFCYVPSPERGALHSQLGMTTILRVAEAP